MAPQEEMLVGKGRILVVDDEPHQRLIMEQALVGLGYEVEVAESGIKALEKLRFGHFDVLLTDLQMPEMDGIRLVENTMIYNSSVSVVVCTAHGTIETAVTAMKKGAEDYLLKPIEFDALELLLGKIFKKRALVRENRKLQTENEVLKRDLGIRYHFTNAIGKSSRSHQVLEKIQEFMKNKVPVLILGEPGVGKEDVARMIHYNGPWAQNSLMSFDCAAVPPEFHETQLFGEEMAIQAGVKTASRPGLIERAHLGTFLIDYVHLLNKKCQPHLSRVLREEKTQRTGGSKFYPVNVRVIATSSRAEFERAVSENGFRWDIHELLLENVVEIPPLRERKEDIPLLVAATAKRFGQAIGKSIEKIDKSVLDRLLTYDFPGNNRELEAMVESAVIRCADPVLKIEHFAFQTGK